MRRKFPLNRRVIDGVEEADDLAVRVEGVRDEDGRPDQSRAGVGDAGLAIARGPIEEACVARGDGWAEVVEQSQVQDEVGERFLSRARLTTTSTSA